MKPLVIARTDQGEAAFREARKKLIGASDGPAILGLNPWSSALKVWLDKTGRTPDFEGNEATHFGNLLEDTVAREFSRRNGVKVSKWNQILAHPDYPFIGATPDRKLKWYDEPAVLELKTALNPRAQKYWEDSPGGVPPMYYAQVQQQLLVTGCQRGFLAVLLSGPEYRDFEIVANLELHESMIKLFTTFWKMVEDDVAPAHDAVDLTLAKALYPESTDRDVVYSEVNHIFHLYMMKRLSKQLDKAIENLQAQIVMEVKDAERVLVPGIPDPVATYSNVRGARWDTKALDADHPELAEQYKKPYQERRFSLQNKVITQYPAIMEEARKALTPVTNLEIEE